MRRVARIRWQRRLAATVLGMVALLLASVADAVEAVSPERQYAVFFGLLIAGASFGAVMQMWAEFRPYKHWRQAVGICGVKVFVAVNVALLFYELFSLHLPALLGISMLVSVGGGLALDRLSARALSIVEAQIPSPPKPVPVAPAPPPDGGVP